MVRKKLLKMFKKCKLPLKAVVDCQGGERQEENISGKRYDGN